MKYVLIDKHYDIIDKIDSITPGGAEHYFMGRKQIEEKEFDKLWKVLSETDYDRQRDLSNRDNKQYEWWKEEQSYLDIDKG